MNCTADNQPQQERIRIDCRGAKIGNALMEIRHDERSFEFFLQREQSTDTAFHAGMFVNTQVTSDDSLSYPREQRFCALFESPINGCYADLDLLVERYSVIFTHQQDLLQRGEPFRELLFGTNWMGIRSADATAACLRNHPEKSVNVSFLGNIQHINSGAYSLRREVAEFAIQRTDVECFGRGIREIPGKAAALEPFRFSIAMENAASDYYFSEKLVDCLLCETVPIYYGCPGIGELLDTRGMLCFTDLSELENILGRVSETLYDQMRPFLLANKKLVIENNWHSHPGLFQRLAASLPNNIGAFPPIQITRSKPRLSLGCRLRNLFR